MTDDSVDVSPEPTEPPVVSAQGTPLAAVIKRRKGRGATTEPLPVAVGSSAEPTWDVVLTDAFRVDPGAAQPETESALMSVAEAPPAVASEAPPPVAFAAPPPPPPAVASPPPLPSEATLPTADIDLDFVEDSIEVPDDTEPGSRVDLRDFPVDIDPGTAVDAVLGFARHNAAVKRTPSAGAWFSELFNADFFLGAPATSSAHTEREAEFIARALGVASGGRLLDLACGYGRHAIALAARGYDLVGLDLSLDMLKAALARAQKASLAIKFVHGDMRDLNFQQVFDGAFCVDTSFGYFSEPENLMVLRGLSDALKSGGRLLLDVANRDYCLKSVPTRNWWEGDGCLVQEDVEFDYVASRVAIKRFSVFADGTQQESNISVRLYALHELTRMLQVAGFEIREVSGHRHTPGAFFGAESARLMVVAQKP
jgi:SAM-dependent methyltransferase